MPRKPNAILHMTAYGAVYGFLLAMLHLWIFVPMIDAVYNTFLELISLTVFNSLWFGMVPGVVIGIITGMVLQTMKIVDYFVVSIIGVLTAILMSLPTVLLASIINALDATYFDTWQTVMTFALPIVISGIAGGYAAHRYQLKWRAWSNQFVDAKHKSKYVPKNKVTYDDNLKPDALTLPDDAQHTQTKQD